MLFDRLLTEISIEDKDDLANLINKQYPFLGEKISELATKTFFLEKQHLIPKKNNQSMSVTCGSLVELITKVFVLKSRKDLDEDAVNNANLRLFELYSNGIWDRLLPSNFDIPKEKQAEIKNLVWQSFLNRLEKDKAISLFCLEKNVLSFQKNLFQSYFNDQLIVYSFKKSQDNQNQKEMVTYQNFFAKTLKNILKYGFKQETNLSQADFEDIVSDRLLDFLEKINRDDFRLTSSLNAYLHGMIKKGVERHFTQQRRSPEITEINPNDLGFEMDEYRIFEEKGDTQLMTKFVIEACKKGKRIDQRILLYAIKDESGAAIAEKLNITPSNVATRKDRFIERILKKTIRKQNE